MKKKESHQTGKGFASLWGDGGEWGGAGVMPSKQHNLSCPFLTPSHLLLDIMGLGGKICSIQGLKYGWR